MISKSTRAVLPAERFYVTQKYNEMVQIAIKVNSEASKQKILNNFAKSFVGLRLCTDGKFLKPAKSEFQVITLPDHFTECDDAVEYMYLNYTPDWSKRMASIAVTKDIVVVNTSHLCADGAFLVNMLNHCLDDDIGEPASLPLPSQDVYKRFFEEFKNKNSLDLYTNNDLTQLPLTRKVVDEGKKRRAMFIDSKINALSTQCYDPETKKVKGLTELLWSSAILSVCAMKNKIDKFGIMNATDWRKFLKPSEINLSHCNHFSLLRIAAPNIRPTNTIRDLHLSLRNDLTKKLSDGSVFASYLVPFESPYPKAALIDVSNLGPLKIKEPIVDFCIHSGMSNLSPRGVLFLISYSKISKTKNEIMTQLTFDQDSIPITVGKRFNDSVLFAMQNIPLDIKIDDAVKQIQKYQRKHEF